MVTSLWFGGGGGGGGNLSAFITALLLGFISQFASCSLYFSLGYIDKLSLLPFGLLRENVFSSVASLVSR